MEGNESTASAVAVAVKAESSMGANQLMKNAAAVKTESNSDMAFPSPVRSSSSVLPSLVGSNNQPEVIDLTLSDDQTETPEVSMTSNRASSPPARAGARVSLSPASSSLPSKTLAAVDETMTSETILSVSSSSSAPDADISFPESALLTVKYGCPAEHGTDLEARQLYASIKNISEDTWNDSRNVVPFPYLKRCLDDPKNFWFVGYHDDIDQEYPCCIFAFTFTGKDRDSMTINLLWTERKHRGNQHATRLISESLDFLTEGSLIQSGTNDSALATSLYKSLQFIREGTSYATSASKLRDIILERKWPECGRSDPSNEYVIDLAEIDMEPRHSQLNQAIEAPQDATTTSPGATKRKPTETTEILVPAPSKRTCLENCGEASNETPSVEEHWVRRSDRAPKPPEYYQTERETKNGYVEWTQDQVRGRNQPNVFGYKDEEAINEVDEGHRLYGILQKSDHWSHVKCEKSPTGWHYLSRKFIYLKDRIEGVNCFTSERAIYHQFVKDDYTLDKMRKRAAENAALTEATSTQAATNVTSVPRKGAGPKNTQRRKKKTVTTKANLQKRKPKKGRRATNRPATKSRKSPPTQPAVATGPVERPRRGETGDGNTKTVISQRHLQRDPMKQLGDRAWGLCLKKLGCWEWDDWPALEIDLVIWMKEVLKDDRKEGVTQISSTEEIARLVTQYGDIKYYDYRENWKLLGKSIHLKALQHIGRRPTSKEIQLLGLTEQDLEPFKNMPMNCNPQCAGDIVSNGTLSHFDAQAVSTAPMDNSHLSSASTTCQIPGSTRGLQKEVAVQPSTTTSNRHDPVPQAKEPAASAKLVSSKARADSDNGNAVRVADNVASVPDERNLQDDRKPAARKTSDTNSGNDPSAAITYANASAVVTAAGVSNANASQTDEDTATESKKKSSARTQPSDEDPLEPGAPKEENTAFLDRCLSALYNEFSSGRINRGSYEKTLEAHLRTLTAEWENKKITEDYFLAANSCVMKYHHLSKHQSGKD